MLVCKQRVDILQSSGRYATSACRSARRASQAGPNTTEDEPESQYFQHFPHLPYQRRQRHDRKTGEGGVAVILVDTIAVDAVRPVPGFRMIHHVYPHRDRKNDGDDNDHDGNRTDDDARYGERLAALLRAVDLPQGVIERISPAGQNTNDRTNPTIDIVFHRSFGA